MAILLLVADVALINFAQGAAIFVYVALQVAALIALIVYYRRALKGDLSYAYRTGLVVFTVCASAVLGLFTLCSYSWLTFRCCQ